MNNIKTLKEIGLKEVARKTHIELRYLEAIVEKDFQSLCKKNVKGYVKILSREYDIDFENWMKEYEDFRLTNTNQDTTQTPFVSPKIPAYRQKDKSSSGFFSIFLILIVVFLAWFFDAAKYITMIPELLKDENRSVTYSDAKVVEEVEKNIIEQNTTNVFDLNSLNLDSNDTNLDTNVSLSQNNLNDSADSLDKNLTTKDANTSSNFDLNKTSFEEIVSKNTVSQELQKVIIKPKTSIWIGIINLENGAKNTVTTNKDYEIDMTKSQLILTGHGNFNININGKNKPSNTQNATRFLVKDGEIKQISADEFVNLNKGKAW